MATMAFGERDRGVAVGRVLDRAFSTIRHQPLPVLTIFVLFAGAPFAAAQYVLDQIQWQYMVVTFGSIYLPGAFAAAIARWFAGLAIGTITQGAITLPVIAESEGRRTTLGETLGGAARVLLPLLILAPIFGIGVIIGTGLLLIPGVLFYLWCAVAPSAEAAEREGVALAFSRSQELGAGARWKIFALLLILIGISVLVAALTASITFLMFRMDWAFGAKGMPFFALQSFASATLNTVWGAVMASLYVELRDWKEGSSPETLEQVFV